MISNKNIVSNIFKDYLFSDSECDFIASNFEQKFYNKGDILLNIDDEVLDQYYVKSGCLRTYFSDDLGKEHTVQFAIKDWWISDYTAYFTQSKSIMVIECIQDAELYKIAKKDLDAMYKVVPSLETFFREKLQNAYAAFQKRILNNLSKSTKEKYIDFITSYPDIEVMVKNYHIASYLGVTTETISRVRKKLINL